MSLKAENNGKRMIGMTELSKIILRQPGTIRKWETDDIIPAHLIPARDENNHRIWTEAQIFGSRGIIAWMERNDMRPGRLMTDPAKEEEHIANLRRPKLLNGDQIRGVRKMVDNGRSREYIINKLHPRTGYSTPAGLESALVRYFKHMGWYFPKKKRKPYPPPHLRMGQPGPKPKKGSASHKRQQAIARRRRTI